MNDLVKILMSQANLSEIDSQKAAEVAIGFLKERLPESSHSLIEAALSNEQVTDGLLDLAKDSLAAFTSKAP